MNCFSHAFRFLERSPFFVAGTCVPDWLSMIDRKVRARRRQALDLVEADDPALAELAQGIVQHHDDDDDFHGNTHFVQLNLVLAIELRELLGADAGFRPHLAAHIMIEMMLDAFLTKQDMSLLDRYYETIAKVDGNRLQNGINQIAARPTQRIETFIPLFLAERYLYDYVRDEGIMYRLNRVLVRVKLNALPERILDWVPTARLRVENQVSQLLPNHGF